MADSIGVGIGVVGMPSNTARIGTLSPFDFAYWASTFVARGTPRDYPDTGPETDGATLVSWSASQIGCAVPTTFTAATAALTTTMTIDAALRKRGAILVGSSKLVVSLGLGDIIDIVNGRYFIRRITSDSEKAKWLHGAQVPGAVY